MLRVKDNIIIMKKKCFFYLNILDLNFELKTRVTNLKDIQKLRVQRWLHPIL